MIHLYYPAHNHRPAIRITSYEGALRPPRPAGLKPEDDHYFHPGGQNEGIMYVGDKGFILAGFNGTNPRVYPESTKYQVAPRSAGATAGEPGDALDQWVAAGKGGALPATHYGLQVGPAESLLLGVLAQRYAGEKLEWDSANMRVTNSEKANAYVNPPYRGEYKI